MLHIPTTIDVSLTGICQLNCAWCWGELHNIGMVHDENKWRELLRKFAEMGTRSVVFTGGETLASPIISSVVRFAKENLKLRTTLSTNAILLANLHEKVLPWVDDLGLPLDGSTPKINKVMRAGFVNNFQNVIDGIKLVQFKYPHIKLTVRTVIARPNLNDVENIPNTLLTNGVELSKIRYKLYQVEPIGPRANTTESKEWAVDENECKVVYLKISTKFPKLSVALQLYKETGGRYFHIGPRGNAYGTNIKIDGKPEVVELGNPIDDFDNTIQLIGQKYYYLSTH